MLDGELIRALLVAVLASLFGGGLLTALLYPRATRPLYVSRFSAIASAPKPPKETAPSGNRRMRTVEETLREIDAKLRAQGRGRGAKTTLVQRLRQARLSWTKQTYFLISGGVGIGSFALAFLLGIQLYAAAGFGLAGGLLLPHLYVGFRRNRRFNRFTAEFPTAVDVIVRGIRSGLPLVDCLKIIATESQEPVRGEFKTFVEDQTLGLPLDEAVNRLAERIPLPETKFFAIVVGIQSRAGGNLSEALSNLSKVLRERKKMKAKIQAMAMEAKASGGIIGALPFVVAGAIYLTAPDYLMLLFTETIGHVTLVISGLWMCIGIFVMRKMINFDF